MFLFVCDRVILEVLSLVRSMVSTTWLGLCLTVLHVPTGRPHQEYMLRPATSMIGSRAKLMVNLEESLLTHNLHNIVMVLLQCNNIFYNVATMLHECYIVMVLLQCNNIFYNVAIMLYECYVATVGYDTLEYSNPATVIQDIVYDDAWCSLY